MTFDPRFRYAVTHPAIMGYVPQNASTPRRVLLRSTTTVAIRHVDADLPVPALIGRIPEQKALAWFGFEGALWTCVGGTDNSLLGVRENDSWDSARLAALLASHDVPGRHIGMALLRSPVVASLEYRSDARRQEWSRGGHLTPWVARRLVEDGRERAAASVERFFAENVVIAGGRVLIKCGDPLAAETAGFHPFPGSLPLWDLLSDLPLAADGRESHACEMLAPEFLDPLSRAHALLQILPEHFARVALGCLRSFLRSRPEGGEDSTRGSVHEKLDRLHPWICRGVTGGIARHEAPAVLDLVCALSDDLSGMMREMSAMKRRDRRARVWAFRDALDMRSILRDQLLPAERHALQHGSARDARPLPA